MWVLRGVLAIVAGYFTMLVVVLAGSFVAALVLSGSAYLVVNVAASVVAAIAGGYAASRLAPRAPLAHALVLGGIVLVIGMLLRGEARGAGRPAWYGLAMPLIGAGGAALGGVLATQLMRRGAPQPPAAASS